MITVAVGLILAVRSVQGEGPVRYSTLKSLDQL